MFNSRASLMSVIAILSLFVMLMCCTITFAYFSATRTTITTLHFHGGTVLSIVGTEYQTNKNNVGIVLNENEKAGKWQSSTNGGAWTTDSSAVVNDSLKLSGLMIKAEQNRGTYVRVFVAVKVDAVSSASTGDGDLTIPELGFTVDGWAVSTLVEQANYTTKEQSFVSANTDEQTTLYTTCAIVTMPDSDDYVKLFDNYTIFLKDKSNIQDSNWQNAHISAMIMLSSTTSNTSDGWKQAQEYATYSFSYA